MVHAPPFASTGSGTARYPETDGKLVTANRLIESIRSLAKRLLVEISAYLLKDVQNFADLGLADGQWR